MSFTSKIGSLIVAGLAASSVAQANCHVAESLRMDVRYAHSGHYKNSDRLEGSNRDMRGRPYRSIKQYLNDESDYVSVVLELRDYKKWGYGRILRIPALDNFFRKKNLLGASESIRFKVVDGFRMKNDRELRFVSADAQDPQRHVLDRELLKLARDGGDPLVEFCSIPVK